MGIFNGEKIFGESYQECSMKIGGVFPKRKFYVQNLARSRKDKKSARH